MKKLLSLTLALLMCLCILIPATAEETADTTGEVLTETPDINLPVTLADYQKAYETIVATIAPDCKVAWSSVEQDSGIVWMAIINDSFTSVMLLTDGENIQEIACLMQSELSNDALLTFLSMGGYAGASLMLDEDTDAVTATDVFMLEMYTLFTAAAEGNAPESICGLPGVISISAMDENIYQYYFVLSLNTAAADEAAAE